MVVIICSLATKGGFLGWALESVRNEHEVGKEGVCRLGKGTLQVKPRQRARNTGGGGKTTRGPSVVEPRQANAQSLVKRLGFDPKGCGKCLWGLGHHDNC